MDEAAEIADAVAPEHLQIATADPLETLSLIRNAGEILLGQHTPFSLANYAIGANAVLPTGGKARTCSALSVRDFMKFSSVACLTAAGYDSLRRCGDHARRLRRFSRAREGAEGKEKK